jgi:hypothetical protein
MLLTVDKKAGNEAIMKKLNDKKRTIKLTMTINPLLDSHNWATKMEIIRIISGKPDLKIKAAAQ